MKLGTALETVKNFLSAFFMGFDCQEAAEYLSGSAIWMTADSKEIAKGREELLRAMKDQFAREMLFHESSLFGFREQVLSDTCATVSGMLEWTCKEAVFQLEMMAVCCAQDGGFAIASVYTTAKAPRLAESCTRPSPDEIENRVYWNAIDLINLSIPGGVMCGYLEEGFPLYYINSRMLQELGYTYEEFVRATDGLVINSIYAEDRDRVDQAVMKAFTKGQEYEIRYRMPTKGGSLIWVSDIGKKSVDEKGAPVCISFVRNITDEIEANRLFNAQALENEKQIQRYNQLFQSVSCGIVRYRLDEAGNVTFKDANLEAIHIFGYEPEEFWGIKSWDLSDLTSAEDMDYLKAIIGKMRRFDEASNYEYRVLRKDRTPYWIIGKAEVILDSDRERIIQSVFLDFDKNKKAELQNQQLSRQVEAGNLLLQMALEHTKTYEFSYYPRERLALVPERTAHHFGWDAYFRQMPESFASAAIEPEFHQDFYEMYRRIDSGEKNASIVFKAKGFPIWCRVTMSAVNLKSDVENTYVVGIAEDITKEKEMEFALEDARSKDLLTGLYSKEAGIRKVKEYMEHKSAREECTIMLLDMDNFHQINQEEGSVFADAMLQDAANILLSESGEDGISVRLGGDEFLLLVKRCDKKRATVLGPRIATKIRMLTLTEDHSTQISASIGMCASSVVNEFSGLYRCAESTLRYVKEKHKGMAACYLDTSNELGTMLTQIYTDEHNINAIEHQGGYQEEDLITFSLELLGKAKRLDDAVSLLLARIGQVHGLDRVTLLEVNSEYQKMEITSQWARRHADHIPKQMVFLSREQLAALSENDESQILSQGADIGKALMPSCRQAVIWDRGACAGVLYFESLKPDYQWPDERCRQLKELTRVISSFIMKVRADSVSQAKTDFLSRMSHEIRTPMNAIAGMTTIAKTVLDDRVQAMACLNKIESANQYLLTLINDILDMSRIESGKVELNLEPVDLKGFLERLEALVLPQARDKEISLVFENDYHANNPVFLDRLRLNQVFVNIVGNAVKFTDSGGTVTVHIGVESQSADSVCLRFCVRDSGIGIEENQLGRIFNAFEQADRNVASTYGGTGLGLSISSRLVQMMNSVLRVKSELGKGSEFYFTLTCGVGRTPAVTASAQTSGKKELDFSRMKILLAEDNELNREIAETLLEMNGFTVESVENGRDAVSQFAQHPKGYFDLILMDIRMPVMDGLEAAKRIRTLGREDSRTVPIIALSANAFDEDSKKSIESGMNGHLSKPIELNRLLEMIEEVSMKPEAVL